MKLLQCEKILANMGLWQLTGQSRPATDIDRQPRFEGGEKCIESEREVHRVREISDQTSDE